MTLHAAAAHLGLSGLTGAQSRGETVTPARDGEDEHAGNIYIQS